MYQIEIILYVIDTKLFGIQRPMDSGKIKVDYIHLVCRYLIELLKCNPARLWILKNSIKDKLLHINVIYLLVQFDL